MVQQKVPPWEPPEVEVVPGSSPCGGEVVVKVFAPRMTPFLNQRSGCLPPALLSLWNRQGSWD
eukprot:1142304-Pelagomonas_calceolata.AAC.5